MMDKELLQKLYRRGTQKIYDLLDMAISHHKTKKAYSKVYKDHFVKGGLWFVYNEVILTF